MSNIECRSGKGKYYKKKLTRLGLGLTTKRNFNTSTTLYYLSIYPFFSIENRAPGPGVGQCCRCFCRGSFSNPFRAGKQHSTPPWRYESYSGMFLGRRTTGCQARLSAKRCCRLPPQRCSFLEVLKLALIHRQLGQRASCSGNVIASRSTAFCWKEQAVSPCQHVSRSLRCFGERGPSLPRDR